MLDDHLELIEFLTNKKVSTLKLDVKLALNSEAIENHITTLYRETNMNEKETGSYDLYIAYPYVEGVFKHDGFTVKAPLLYFPVKLVRNKREYSIKKKQRQRYYFLIAIYY